MGNIAKSIDGAVGVVVRFSYKRTKEPLRLFNVVVKDKGSGPPMSAQPLHDILLTQFNDGAFLGVYPVTSHVRQCTIR
jgi:hypothetical protein